MTFIVELELTIQQKFNYLNCKENLFFNFLYCSRLFKSNLLDFHKCTQLIKVQNPHPSRSTFPKFSQSSNLIFISKLLFNKFMSQNCLIWFSFSVAHSRAFHIFFHRLFHASMSFQLNLPTQKNIQFNLIKTEYCCSFCWC